MALEAPLRASTESLPFPFTTSPDKAARSDRERLMPSYRIMSPPPASSDPTLLRPDSANFLSSNISLSPSDIVGPSPVTSNGTEITEIEDDVAPEVRQDQVKSSTMHGPELRLLATNLASSILTSSPDEAISAIHAPESFAGWTSTVPTITSSLPSGASSPKDSASQLTGNSYHGPHRPPLFTNVKPVRYSVDSATPRAQDLRDMLSESARMRSDSTSSLEKIDEQTEAEGDDDYDEDVFNVLCQSDEISALQAALSECWVLCNTMASLSSVQRAKLFRNSRTPDPREMAWGSCWKLCQSLYNSQGEIPRPSPLLNLELCRDFCQALFDVREKQDEMSDSILRVSFELNNHLYTAQGSNLPEQFQKRTLDFYITLCHRLMKQREDLQSDADQLLRACWELTETFFSLWQNRLEERPLDEDTLGSAVQACWDLCDLFKRSCRRIRPDRSSTRSTQTSFFSLSSEATGRESRQSNRSRHSKRESVKSVRQEERPRKPPPVPDTPVTDFEDTAASPERSPTAPDLMILGTTGDHGRGGRWSSSASNLSSYSHTSNRTSSTATKTKSTAVPGAEDANMTRAKILVLRAAMNLGFDRDDPKAAAPQLLHFVQDLAPGSLGPLSAHASLLQQYKNSVLTDALIPRAHPLPSRGMRVSAPDMAKSIQVLSATSHRYLYLRDLFKLVFQFSLEEADLRRHVSIVV